MNVDIKPNMMCKNIKKEPDFMVREIKKEPDFVVREIKKEPDFVVREIKKEPCRSDQELVAPQLTELPYKSKKKKQKTKINKTIRKATAKAKKRSLKKYKGFTQSKKTKSCNSNVTSQKSKRCKMKTKKKRKKKSKNTSKSSKSIKKEANTLLDQQGNGDLHLFGFKDELEYFSLESDHEESEKTSPEKSITGKRTSLSSLSARKKVVLALKSAPIHPSSNPKPLLQHPKHENIDVLDSILKSQTLWHSKTSHMKVNEDGSVEVIDRKNKKLVESESSSDKEISLLRNKTNSSVSTQARHCSALVESLNLNKNSGSHSMKMNVKIETCSTRDTERMIDENKEQIQEAKIKVEGKKEKKFFSASEMTFANSPIIEISDDEVDDCPIFSVYSKASKIFSLQRDKERQTRFLSDESEIQIIDIKKSEKVEIKKPSKRHKNYHEEAKYIELDSSKKRARNRHR